MRHMEKSKAKAREMEEILSLKANQEAQHQEGCHTWKGRETR